MSEKESIKLLIKPDFEKYYNINRLFSYQDIHVYIVIGGRGIGKTTSANIHNILDYMKNGNQFVYCRRYITELKKTKTMFDPIVSNKVTIKGYGHGAFEWDINGSRIGYGVALTAQQTLKSGMDFSKVTTLVFDEAILPTKGASRYLPDEIEIFFELISTIFRDRKNYKIFVFGNNADIFNPYFSYFNIPSFERNYIDKSRGLYCEKSINSPILLEAEKETPLYKLTQGTQYFEYHYNNEVLMGEVKNIGEKSKQAKLVFRLILNDYTLNIYRQELGTIFVELRDKIIKDELAYVILEDGNPNYHYMQVMKENGLLKFLTTCFYTDGVTYENEMAFTLFVKFLEEI